MAYDLKWRQIDYTLDQPMMLAYGPVSKRKALILRLASGDYEGFGELVFISYYNADKDYDSLLTAIAEGIQDKTFEANEFYEYVALYPQIDRFLTSALDIAHWDLLAKSRKVPLWKFLGLTLPTKLNSFITLSGEAAQHEQYKKWPFLKIKMGYPGELELLQWALRSPSQSKIIIDANRGWDLDRAFSILRTLSVAERSRIAYIEEPFGLEALEQDYKTLKAGFGLPILADESFQHYADFDVIANRFDAINLKLMKCGGLSPALHILEEAQRRGLNCIGGCMASSSIATLPIVHLASKLQYLDVDGSHLLADDPWGGIELINGAIHLTGGAGLGLFSTPKF